MRSRHLALMNYMRRESSPVWRRIYAELAICNQPFFGVRNYPSWA